MKILISLIVLIPNICFGQDTLFINDLGLEANSRINAIPYINKAIEQSKGKKNVVIAFKKGRYDFWQQYSTEKDYYESNTTYSNPRFCAFVIEKMQDITIDCGGSDFIFHGKMQPFSIDRSSNVTIKNLSIDWEIPFGAEAEIIEVAPDYFDLKIDICQHPYIIENDKLWFVGEGWKNMFGGEKWNDPIMFDRETLHVTAGTNDDLMGGRWENIYTAKEISKGVVRIFYNKTSLLKKGNYLVLRIGVRDHAGVYIVDSKNILLENINMYSNSGLGYLAQYSENLTYKNVNCLPSPDRKVMSCHDDGLHFSNCRGQIITDRCTMKGLMDDSYNVHGSYVIIAEKLNEKTLLCKFPHHQSFGLIWARAGESIAFIDGQKMKNYGVGIVDSVKARNSEFFEITFKTIVPKEIDKKDALENITWEPDVTITNCYFGSHRARGVLISTGGKVLIDNNVFESSGSAIVFPGDIKEYFENGPIKDATISNNTFKSSCLTSEYMTCEGVISIALEVPDLDTKNPPIHKNIKIFNNTFEMFDYPVLYALSVDGISFNNNIIKHSKDNIPWHKNKQNLTFNSCRNIEVKGNKIEKDVLGKNIKLIHAKRSELSLDMKQGFFIEN